MSVTQIQFAYRSLQIMLIICVAGLLPYLAHAEAEADASTRQKPAADVQLAAAVEEATSESIESLLERDPQSVLCMARDHCRKYVRDFRCTFVKQERKGRKLSDEEVINVLYREEPQSVYMTWVENANRVKRVLYIEDRFIGKRGEQEALVEPTGVARLFCSEARIDIHGKDARKSGRYTVDQFGFRAVLDLLCEDNARLDNLDALDIAFQGEDTIDGRPTYVIVRELPKWVSQDISRDVRLIIHLDQEWLVPVAIYSYADEHERELLGKYVMVNVDLNLGLGETHFKF